MPCVEDPNGGLRDDPSKGIKSRFRIVKRLRDGVIPYGFSRWPDGSMPEEARIPTFLERVGPPGSDYRLEVPWVALAPADVPTVSGETA